MFFWFVPLLHLSVEKELFSTGKENTCTAINVNKVYKLSLQTYSPKPSGLVLVFQQSGSVDTDLPTISPELNDALNFFLFGEVLGRTWGGKGSKESFISIYLLMAVKGVAGT